MTGTSRCGGCGRAGGPPATGTIRIPKRRASRGVASEAVWHPHAVRRIVLLALATVALAAVVIVGLGQAGGDEDAPPEPLTREEVLESLEGAPPQLAALHRRASELVPGGERAFDAELRRLRGRPVVVNFWASWCGPCRLELPYFQAQAIERGRTLAFLGVNVEDARDEARAMLREFFLPFPSIEDSGSRITQRLGAQGLPITAFYDRRGQLSFLHQGQYPSEAALAEDIERYAA